MFLSSRNKNWCAIFLLIGIFFSYTLIPTQNVYAQIDPGSLFGGGGIGGIGGGNEQEPKDCEKTEAELPNNPGGGMGGFSQTVPVADDAVKDVLDDVLSTLEELLKETKEVRTNTDQIKEKEKCLDVLATRSAQSSLSKMTEEVGGWANEGFEGFGMSGEPFFIKDTSSLFQSVSDQEVKNLVDETLNFSDEDNPFKKEIVENFVTQYKKGYAEKTKFSLNNYTEGGSQDNYYGDFKKGGWDAWNAQTQLEQNNFLGSTFLAENEASSRVNEKQGSLDKELNYNGYLSQKTCVKEKTLSSGEKYCEKYENTTPGSLIKDQLESVMSSSIILLQQHREDEELSQGTAGTIGGSGSVIPEDAFTSATQQMFTTGLQGSLDQLSSFSLDDWINVFSSLEGMLGGG